MPGQPTKTHLKFTQTLQLIFPGFRTVILVMS